MRKKSFYSKLVSCLLIITIIVSGLSGFVKPQVVSAQETPTETISKVLYVDGVGSGTKDGLSATNAFATLAEAYAQVPSDNVKTIIVICGEVSVNDSSWLLNATNNDRFKFPEHSGEVVITSVYGNEDYKDTAGIRFSNRYYLQGDTTFANVRILSSATRILASYHSLHLGEGIEGTFSGQIYVGNNSEFAKPADDAVLTIDSGTVTSIYGGGHQYSGSNTSGKNKDVTININGGTITNLYGTGVPSNTTSTQHKNINININGGDITNLYGAYNKAQVLGEIKIVLNGGNVNKLCAASTGNEAVVSGGLHIEMSGTTVTTLDVAQESSFNKKIIHYNNVENANLHTGVLTGFDTLKLTGSTVTVPAGMEALFDTVTKLEMTDDSALTFATVPVLTNTTGKVAVSITQADAGAGWNTTTPLITAPLSTGDIFNIIAPVTPELNRIDSDTVSTWTFGQAASDDDEQEEPTLVLYVDGVGSTDADGSKEKPLATLAEAYAKIPTDNKKTIIVITGAVSVGTGFDLIKNTAGRYAITPHNGEVVITSKYDGVNYGANVGVGIGFDNGRYYLQGDTTFENIKILSSAARILADYHSLHLGNGLEGTFAGQLCVGNNYEFPLAAYDAVLTIDSGIVTSVYGGGYNYSGSGSAGKDKNVTININGGTITNLYGTGASPSNVGDVQHKGITINVNGGTITNLYGATNKSLVSGGIRIMLNGGTVTNLYGVTSGNQAVITGGLYVEMGGATVENMNMAQESSIDKKIVHYNNVQDVTLPTGVMTGFDTLKLTGSDVIVPTGMETIFNTVLNVVLTDDSSIMFNTIPVLANSAEKVKVTVTQADADAGWNTTTPLITAPAGTEDIFKVVSPLTLALVKTESGANAVWTLEQATPDIGQAGTKGDNLNIDLGLAEDGHFTALNANATPYEVYLQKLQDLGVAKDGANVISAFAPKGAVEIYVAPGGDDAAKGTYDEPLKTIAKALEYVEAFQASGDVKGIVVFLRAGTYVTSETITLNSAHSGKNGVPVFISAYNGENVTISGGANIEGSAFKPVTEVVDESVYSRLQDSVRGNIVAVKLDALKSASSTSSPKYQVLVNGEALTLARYPNAKKLALTGNVIDIGKITVDYSDLGPKGTNDESTGIEYMMTDLRPTGWYNDGKIWLTGSLYAEWAINTIRIAEIKEETGSIKLAGHTGLGAKSSTSNTYFYFNILEELDVPGEYYLDTDNGILYLYPICDMSSAVVTYSAMQSSLICLEKTENVILNGLKLENCADYGVYMQDCKQTVVQNCEISNVRVGAHISGEKSGVIYSDISNTANKPVEFSTLRDQFDYTPELNFVQNCYIHTTGTANGKLSCITLAGTSCVVSHNLIQGTYASSIYLTEAKECIVEYNEIVGGPTGLYDMGAIYVPYKGPTYTGNHIRYNYIHDIGINSEEYNPSAIYFDEGLRGSFAYGNIIKNVPCGFLTNSGSENVIINNVVLDGRQKTVRGLYGSNNFAAFTITDLFTRHNVLKTAYNAYWLLSEAEQAALKGRYPLMVVFFEEIKAAITEDGNQSRVGFAVAHGNYVANNLLYDSGIIGFDGTGHTIQNNTVITDATQNPFVDVDNHNYSLKTGFSTDFTYTIPSMDDIGVTRTKQGVGAVIPFGPQANSQKVDPTQVLFQWTNGAGADGYVLKIATNAALTENVKELSMIETYRLLEGDEYFTFDTTYYWTVLSVSTAESRNVTTAGGDTVLSFKTMTRDEYIAANSADVSELEATVDKAEDFLAQMKEVSEGGLYPTGTKAKLQTAINEAKTVIEAAATMTQADVDQENEALKNAIIEAETARPIQYITFDQLDAADWLDQSAGSAVAVVTQDELKWTVNGVNSTQVMYRPGVGTRDILKFKFKFDTLQSGRWFGFSIAHSNIDKFITSTAETDGYLICLKGDQLELQKRKGGTDYGNLAVVINNHEILTYGTEWYEIELGAINHADGSVQIIFKVNGVTVFDYLDTVDAIAGANGFGIVVQKEERIGSVHLAQADLTNVQADYSELDTELQKAEELTESDYTEASWSAYEAVLEQVELLPDGLTVLDQNEVDQLVVALKAAREALVEKPVVLSSGTNTSYTKESDGNITIHCSGAFSEFVSVSVDGTVVANSKYTVVEGSTVITLAAEYLDTLQAGKHTMTLAYTGDRSVDVEISILAAVEVSTEQSTESSTEQSTESSTEQSTESSTEQNTESSTEQSTESSTEQSTESSTEQSTESSNEQNTESSTEASTEFGTEDSEEPDTGDNSRIWIWMLVMVACIGIELYFFKKKRLA